MNELTTNLLYFSLNCAIDGVKWVERRALQISPVASILKNQGKKLAESIGVVFDCPGDPEWTDEDIQKVLGACPNYETVIHIRIHDDKEFFTRVVNKGSLGLGETYMDETWDGVYGGGEDISQMTKRILENNVFDQYWNQWNRGLEWIQLSAFDLQKNTKDHKPFQEGKELHDLGDDLYELMLDPWMQYSCGYWAYAANLNEAQLHKMELIARKLDLKPGMRILDLGCGWSHLCKFLAKRYKVQCVGVTNSEDKFAFAQKVCRGFSVAIRLQDYRLLNEEFDRIVCVGMFEYVGNRNYRTFLEVAERCLKSDGIFLLQTAGRNHLNVPRSESWLHTYIFPNEDLPSAEDITKETSGLFVIEDWHNFGLDYAKTLNAWRENFVKRWPTVRNKYGDRFFRMWLYYLSSCRGVFLAKRTQLWQIVLSKDGIKNDYRAVR